MKYFKVDFYIHCPTFNKEDREFSSSKDKAAFEQECVELFLMAGWKMRRDAVYIYKGKQFLYLWADRIHGIISDTEIDSIAALLQKSATFIFLDTKVHYQCFCISDKKYTQLLESKKDQISDALLQAFKTEREDQYIDEKEATKIRTSIGGSFGLRRVRKLDIEYCVFVADIFEHLEEMGKIVTMPLQSRCKGYRTATTDDSTAKLKADYEHE